MSGRGFDLRDYATVDERITRYWEMHPKPEGSIQTEVIWVADDGSSVAIKATVHQGERILATGIAQEERGSKGANSTSWWENCETSAIGRALANMDMSLSKNRPSRQEMEKVERYAESPPPPGNPAPSFTRPRETPAAPPNVAPQFDADEFTHLIDEAWAMAEDGKALAAIKDLLNRNRHRMTKAQMEHSRYAIAEIEAKFYTPASIAG